MKQYVFATLVIISNCFAAEKLFCVKIYDPTPDEEKGEKYFCRYKEGPYFAPTDVVLCFHSSYEREKYMREDGFGAIAYEGYLPVGYVEKEFPLSFLSDCGLFKGYIPRKINLEELAERCGAKYYVSSSALVFLADLKKQDTEITRDVIDAAYLLQHKDAKHLYEKYIQFLKVKKNEGV